MNRLGFDHMSHVSLSGMSLADSLAWQTNLPNATADNTFLLNQAHVQYQSGTGASTVKKHAETLRLASAS